jgi:hypothetical protein
VKALLVVCVLATAAHADKSGERPTRSTAEGGAEVNDKPSPPDPDTEDAAGEANLESNAPRAGMTFSASIGAGITMGDGVGRGEALSFRIGHVATPSSVLTLEFTGGSLFHQEVAPMGKSDIFHNDYFALMAGGLHYVSGSFWVRGAGGLASYTIDAGSTTPRAAHFGVGGIAGLGLDFVRWHYLVLGLETFAQMGVVATRGLMLNTGLCLGLTYY